MQEAEKSARRWREFDIVLARTSLSWEREARRHLVSEAMEAANQYRERGEAAALASIADAAWVEYLNRVWRYSVAHAGVQAAAVLGLEADARFLESAAVRYLEREAVPRGAGIAQTSRNNVEKWIEQGKAEGLEQRAIARKIAGEGVQAAQWRGATIGSTETHAASWYGAWLSAGRSPVRLVKIWAAPRRAGITCDQHGSTHGQRREVAAPFQVLNDYEPDQAADALDFPGDGTRGARASNVINCRCAMDFEREG